ncbi:hypothetical protein NEIFL0001_0335, partial [Neisseria flavescens SK114]
FSDGIGSKRTGNLPTARIFAIQRPSEKVSDGLQSINQRIMPRVDCAKKSLNTANSLWVSARFRMSALASSKRNATMVGTEKGLKFQTLSVPTLEPKGFEL